ncbi:hypothetical protein Taro_014688 [Colocasia esculenta]|uniref:Uncharacterized protein n=1 Tax=Colocasia esculenta TaxID=4460 RepID=A0A843UIT2_COLES|nr:hypothetical protein [Colocasia esculenta]
MERLLEAAVWCAKSTLQLEAVAAATGSGGACRRATMTWWLRRRIPLLFHPTVTRLRASSVYKLTCMPTAGSGTDVRLETAIGTGLRLYPIYVLPYTLRFRWMLQQYSCLSKQSA